MKSLMVIDWTSLTTIVGLIVGGIVTIVREIRSSRTVITAGQTASAIKVHEIHLLVNSRLLAVLRMLAAVTKREAERTNDPTDRAIYESARDELAQAEEAAKASALMIEGNGV